MPSKHRAGTKARPVANVADAGEHLTPLHAQNKADAVLRHEKDTHAATIVPSSSASPVLRTAGKSTASPFASTELKLSSDEAKSSADAGTAKLKEIRLSAVAQPAVSRGHRIPSSRPVVNNLGTTTTTAAALTVLEAEPLGWKHGLVPGILAYFQVEEGSAIQISIAVVLGIIAFGMCACRFAVAKPEETPEVTGADKKPTHGSLFNGLSSVDFIDEEDRKVQAMLQKIWDARKSPSVQKSAEKFQSESRVRAEKPATDIVQDQPQAEEESLFKTEDIRRQVDDHDSHPCCLSKKFESQLQKLTPPTAPQETASQNVRHDVDNCASEQVVPHAIPSRPLSSVHEIEDLSREIASLERSLSTAQQFPDCEDLREQFQHMLQMKKDQLKAAIQQHT